MNTGTEPDDMATAVATALEGSSGLRAAYLFGSRTTDAVGPDSDVDVGVLRDHRLSLDEIVRLEQRLEAELGMHVDVVDLGSASAFLALDIIRGRRVLCRDQVACDEFELYVLRRAGDLAPFERARREMLLRGRP